MRLEPRCVPSYRVEFEAAEVPRQASAASARARCQRLLRSYSASIVVVLHHESAYAPEVRTASCASHIRRAPRLFSIRRSYCGVLTRELTRVTPDFTPPRGPAWTYAPPSPQPNSTQIPPFLPPMRVGAGYRKSGRGRPKGDARDVP